MGPNLQRSRRRGASVGCVRRALTVVALLWALSALLAQSAGALTAQQASWLALAQSGAARAQGAFSDGSHGIWNGHRNVPLQWYDERLRSGGRYPLATIWGSVPLFETLAAIAIADPTPANRRALAVFARGGNPPPAPPGQGPARGARSVYRGAEAYWDRAMGAFAPYPGDRGPATTWFDDNSWWGVAFLDAYGALGDARLLRDAQTAFSFVAGRGWDRSGQGGLWWNTAHTPGGQKSGEALAAGSLLGAQLAVAWRAYASSAAPAAARAALAAAASDRSAAQKFISWGDAHFAGPEGLYVRTQADDTPMPYVAGPQIEANELLCRLPGGTAYCSQAARLADAAYNRFEYRLNMGPQFDAIYLHWMLVYGAQTGDSRWAQMALHFAAQAQANARDRSGLYLRAWDGGDMAAHQAEPEMLRTDAATVELFGWLAATRAG
jgi:Glycosyl hydrolase family 76